MSAKPNDKGELAIAICPDCGEHSVCDPVWLGLAGKTLDMNCANCLHDEWETSHHLIVQFNRQPTDSPKPIAPK